MIEKTVQCNKNVLVFLAHCYIALKSNLYAPHLGEGRLLLLKEILLLLEHTSSLGENCNIPMDFIETLQIIEQKPFTGVTSSVMRREKKKWKEGEC